MFNPRHITGMMTKNTTFEQYLKNHPFGNYELYTEAIRKILVAEFNRETVKNGYDYNKPTLKPFTIWMHRKKPTNTRSVFRLAVLAGVSSDKLRTDLESLGFLTSEASLLDDKIISKLRDLSPDYKKAFFFFPIV